jgi:formamidopyrimidine-DNA glycosylase
MNAPGQEKEECPNCGEPGIIERVKIDGARIPYCNNCEHELKTIK